jgi:cysteine-rich repeat protein
MIATPVFAQYGFEYATALGLGTRDLRSAIMQVINILLGFLGVISIGIMLYGGFLYMTSQGAADKIEKAKKILINGAIGLAIILSSYAIAFFIVNALTNVTGIGESVCDNDGFCVAPENCANCASDCGSCPAPPPSGGTFTVSWVDPADTEANVSLCRLIQIKFNQDINPDTIDNIGPWGGSFTVDSTTAKSDVNLWIEIQGGLSAGAGCVANDQCASGVCAGSCQGDLVSGDITLWPNAKGLTFNNTDDFKMNTIYQATIKSDMLALNGIENTLGSRLNLGDYIWNFTTGDITDTVPPTVVTVFPTDTTTDVCLETTISAVFNEPMDVASLLSTDIGNQMDPNTTNSIYMEAPNVVSGFIKSINGPKTLITKPKDILAAMTPYTPVLDSDVIRDTCGNYLDGNANGVAEFSPADDYAPPPVGVAPDWSFTTGTTIECTPEITSIVPATGYYNDESIANADLLTINGNYFTIAGSLFFNNNVEVVSTGTNYCIDPATDPDYIPTEQCLISWTDNQIQVRIPAKNGASNGAKTGNITVEVGIGNISNAEPFTVLSPRIDNIFPKQGGIDQFITIEGSNFGAVQGPNDHVYFRRDDNVDGQTDVTDANEIIEANYPCAGGTGWNDNQIIISVPNNVNFDDAEDWHIQVVINQTTDNYWGNLSDFKFIDVVPGPGLCSVVNMEIGSPYIGLSEGLLDETVQFSGVRFNDANPPVDQEVNFGNYASPVPAKNIVNWVYGPPDTVDADVPNIGSTAPITVGTFLKVDGQNSNTINFKVHPTTAGPHIDYFEPISGAVGEYITIYGSDFESWDGRIVSNVQFSDGAGGLIDGDFAFPPACGDSFWTDSQIVVKVPAGAGNSIPLNDDFIIVTARSSLSDDTSDLSPDEFIVTPGPAGPGICNISPKSGPIGTAVDLFGERFTGVTDVKFFNNKNALSYAFVDDENIDSAVSPDKTTPGNTLDDAVSGPITVEIAAQISNGYNFAVFDCREAAGGCADIGTPGFECCYDGSCMDPAAGGCASPTAATYAWNFSTGAYTSCSGYSMNQCLASDSCPNSPGQCSPSPDQTDVDTGNDCGDNYCNTNFPIDCAGSCAFSNNTCTSPTTCDISKDANLVVAGLSGIAKCNKVDGNNLWQTNVPCQSGTYLDTNGQCTLGSVSVPIACNPNCADSFDCVNLGGIDGACVKSNICPNINSACVADIDADGIDDCVRDIPGKCECCCRVDHSDTDCCAGLTCEDDTCGTDDANYTYGYCKGCAVWDMGTFFQTLSDDDCGCASNTRVCIADELLAIPPAHDIGFCGDCANINDIDYDSDGSGLFDPVADSRHECKSHGVCCWNSIINSCYTCDTLEVIEDICPPAAMSSPSPYKEESDVCLNSIIYLKFNLEIDPATVATGVEVYECTAGGRNCTATAVTAGTPGLIGLHNELIFTPSANFNPDTWYKVIINQTLKDLNGLNLDSNYEWYFKTKVGTGLCAIETIQVTPENEVIDIAFDTRNYNALPTAECTVLNPLAYDWNWQSSDMSIATITNNDVAPVDGLINPTQTATAQDINGSTQIIASVPAEGKQGETTLYVLMEDIEVVDYWPDCEEACLNASLGAEFNIAADPLTLNLANIELYEWYCGNTEIDIGEDCDDGNTDPGDGCSDICLNEGSPVLSQTELAFYDASDLINIPADSIQVDAGNNVYSVVGHRSFISSTFIPVDTAKRYLLSGRFKSMGAANSRLYYGLAPYDASYNFISAWDVLRTGNDATITAFTPTSITVNETFSGWAQPPQIAGRRTVGFYYDGNTNHLPDYVYYYYPSCSAPIVSNYYCPDAAMGVYSSAVGNTMSLNNPIPAAVQSNIILGTTVIKNHRSGGTYMYSAAGYAAVPYTWTDYVETNITGEGFGGNSDMFRTGTKYVKILFLNNYRQTAAEEIWFDDILFAEVQDSCGDGIIQHGEECDDSPFPLGCSTPSCLHTGSVAGFSVCGDGIIGIGEDCDDGGSANGDGCSSICLNEGKSEFIPAPPGVPLGAITPNIDNTIIDISLPVGDYFKANTHYRTFLFDGITNILNQKPLSGLNWDFDKDTINDSFSWNFKTKESYCSPDFINIDPKQKTIYNINTTQDYEATPYGSPDSCNPRGQKLNPYWYNWSWNSTNPTVADFMAPFPANNWPGCGNNNIELGEDCDDGNNLSGDGCSDICLNEGTSRDMGLVSHWALDEGSDVFAYDSEGSNDGTLVGGPLWSTGKFGGALEFDGVDDRVLINDDQSLDIERDITIGAWIYRKGTGSDVWGDMIFAKHYTHNMRSYDLHFNSSISPNNPRFQLFQTDNTGFSLDANTTILNNKWYHIVGKYDYASGIASIYINGDLKNTANFGQIDIMQTSMPATIGSYLHSVDGSITRSHFNGIIDDVRIYNTALTGAQIQGIMSRKNYLCGNGVVDPGEDCDSAPVFSGCIDCGGGAFPVGCDINTCLHTGVMPGCGNGIIDDGEDCDDGNDIAGDGCSLLCLNEGTQTDSFIDFYQTVTTKSPGITDIEASLNYCSDDPLTTCGGALPACTTGICSQTKGIGELEIVCGFSNDDSCSQGVCSAGFCTNNSSIACTVANEAVNCDLTDLGLNTCDFDATGNHTCPINIWGGTCSTSGDVCYSVSGCPDTEVCQPHADCNHCANNTSFECRTANNLVPGPGNSDCRLGVGYDSCCYGRPKIENGFPDPSFFNSAVIDCNNNATPLDNTDDYCSAFGVGTAGCQTYICKDNTCSAYGRCSIQDGLIGHWRLDESPAIGGNTIFDSSGGGNNGVLVTGIGDTADKASTGKIAGALSFDGITDRIQQIPSTNEIEYTGDDMSISVWAYPHSSEVDGGHIVSKPWNGSGQYNYRIIWGNDNTIMFYLYGDKTSGLATDNTYTKEEWHHIVVTIDGSSKLISIYIDGKLDKSAVHTINNWSPSSGDVNIPLSIGTLYPYGSNWDGSYGGVFPATGFSFDGRIDSVAIYDRTLMSGEISSLFNSYCLNNNDCPASSVCDKTCADDSDCNDIVCAACRNAQININFNKLMDHASFNGDRVCSNNKTQSCGQDADCNGGVCLKNIRLGVKYDDAAINQKNCPTGYYAESGLVQNKPKGFFGKIIAKIKTWFNQLLGRKEIIAAEYWCAIPGTISSFDSNNRTTAVFTPKGLFNNLFEKGTTYRITVKHSVKRTEGVAMGIDDTEDFQYEFTASDTECQVQAVEVYVDN